MNKNIVLLWDIDGTLISQGGDKDLFHEVALSFSGKVPMQRPKKAGKTDSRIATEYIDAYKIDNISLDTFMFELNSVSDLYYSNNSCDIIKGAIVALESTSRLGLINKLYTGNTASRAINKLNSANIPLEAIDTKNSFFLGDRILRLDGVLDVKRQHSKNDIVVIGDTDFDYELAKSLDCNFWFIGKEVARENQIGVSQDFSNIDLFISKLLCTFK